MKKVAIAISIICIFGFKFNISHAESVWDEPTIIVQEGKRIEAVVYRSPTCGCCSKWLAHLKTHGFNVQDNVVEDIQQIKDKYGVSRSLSSCHTAIIDGYVVEGHVPANDIKTMLRDKPGIKGLTVPGMEVGTPGMEMGDKQAPFNVMAFDSDGQVKLYKAYDKY
ncbi:hypothetical protein AU255_17550 [Methyloprofundus sedimenti]|uniref:CopG family transcriptional regulator n=1 Tax=Methyloprofundus sedimenti TaxID=1420851 RepID=A0A1V8M181_9GAMM|nr:DUF411 domain-containing protein [Methyloprofundus sedimenti]OQK15282.1 hypothetical protein AU255_17550 [Methyloprofundus sedimenti]